MNSSNIDPKNSMDRSPALRAFLIVAVLLLSLGVMSPRSDAAVTLDPNNPSNFTKDGTQTFTIGSVLTLTAGNVGDFIALFAPECERRRRAGRSQRHGAEPARAARGQQLARGDAHLVAHRRVRGRECRGQMHRRVQRVLFGEGGVPLQRAGSATYQSRWIECV